MFAESHLLSAGWFIQPNNLIASYQLIAEAGVTSWHNVIPNKIGVYLFALYFLTAQCLQILHTGPLSLILFIAGGKILVL